MAGTNVAKVRWELMGNPQMKVQVVPLPHSVPHRPDLHVWAPEGTEINVDVSIRVYVPPGAQVGMTDFDSLFSNVCDVVEESGRG